MGDLLTTSVSGMLTYQRALSLTGHNIANVNTPGYSRQVAEFSSRPGQATGAGFIGSGVQISTIKRVYDELLGQQFQGAVASQSRLSMMNTLAGQIDGLLASPETSLSPALQSFFNAVQDVANDPASLSGRQVMLGEAEGLVQRLQGIDARLRDIDVDVNNRVQQSINEINDLVSSVASLNKQVVLAQGQTGQPPNDLLDQRDLLIGQLAAKIGITTTTQDDGSINVFIGTGQTLVIGTEGRKLGLVSNEFDPTRSDVVFQGLNGNVPIDAGKVGSELGGLLEFRTQMLDSARQMLGETALALTSEFNLQHASGMDMRGALGGNFFSPVTPSVLPSSGNTGTGAISASVTDTGALASNDYILEYDGASYSLRTADTGQAVAMTGSGTVGDPFLAQGISIVTSGAPAAGDKFMLLPARDTISNLSVVVTDAQAIAMAAPTRTLTGASNIGDAVIGQSQVVDPTDAGLLTTSVIAFTGPSTYSINGAGAFAYTSGSPIVINGSQFEITGTPQTGDQFTLEANTGGVGDNRNGLQLSQIQTRGILAGNTISINDNYGRLIADVGGTSRQIQTNLGAQNVIVRSIEDSISSKSGVNLDEEAARLIQYQQVYQALAQVIAVASTLFDTLLNAVRR